MDKGTVITILIIILIVALVFAVIGRLFRVAIAIAALTIIVPIFTTVLWGDGTTYIQKFSSLFNQEIGTQIEQGYEQYREKEQSDPVYNGEAVNEAITHVFEKTKDVAIGVKAEVIEALMASDVDGNPLIPPELQQLIPMKSNVFGPDK